MGWLREPELSAGHSSDMRFPGSSEGGGGGVRLCPTHLAELPETNRKEVKITLEETDRAISNRVQEKTRNQYAVGHSLPVPPLCPLF